MERVWYNSCWHRLCPPWTWLPMERWLAQQQARLLACDHYHIIFTLPDELRGLWLGHVRAMTNLLFAVGHETRVELLGDAKYLGACPGIIAALHTWSQTLVLPPHLHGVVTGGGLTAARQWRSVRNGLLLPVRVVMAVFRGKLFAAVDTAIGAGQLSRERSPHGTGVLTYLARYIRGGPLPNQRLVSSHHGEVMFRYRVSGEAADRQAQGLLTLPLLEFSRRYLLHVPEPGTKVVRCDGLYAPTKQEALAVCRVQLGQALVEAPERLDWQRACQARGEDHPERCPRGGRLLTRLGLIPRASGPPLRDRAGERGA